MVKIEPVSRLGEAAIGEGGEHAYCIIRQEGSLSSKQLQGHIDHIQLQ